MKYSIILFVVMSLVLSCTQNEITPPPDNPGTYLSNTLPVANAVMENMEGIYTLSSGDNQLGTEFVCKVSLNKVTFFSNQGGIFFILDYGLAPDGAIRFSGFWRVSENRGQGLIAFNMPANLGASDLINSGNATGITMGGTFKSGTNMVLKYDRPFSSFTKANEFMIFGHHGVQTTANPPYAENSIKGVLNARGYGVNGIEYDIRLTKDNIPICIHDAAINNRLTLKGPLFGNYEQYSFKFLEQYVILVDGEKIPSLDHVLKVMIDSTDLKYAWLDIKGNPDVFKYLEPVIRNAYARALAKNRDVTIFAGLPSDDVITEFNKQPTYKSGNPNWANDPERDTNYPAYTLPLPTLCELSIDCAIANGSKFFGPRYSLGLLLNDVQKAHGSGIKVISWTLNDKNTMKTYLKDGQFDGFITDYPAFVNYFYYTMF
jgi:glycerophosphoryl diester phosphodiesterase